MRRAVPPLASGLFLLLGGCIVGGANGQIYSDGQRGAYKDFDRIEASTGVEVVVAQGGFDVKAEARDGGDFSELVVEVKGQTLHIGRKQGIFGSNRRYRVNVTAPTYTAFDASSGASINGRGLSLRKIEIEASSGAAVSLDGACEALSADVSSGGSLAASGLRCQTGEVNASSGASAEASVSGKARGEASSGGSIVFQGPPAQLERETSSGGSVSAR